MTGERYVLAKSLGWAGVPRAGVLGLRVGGATAFHPIGPDDVKVVDAVGPGSGVAMSLGGRPVQEPVGLCVRRAGWDVVKRVPSVAGAWPKPSPSLSLSYVGPSGAGRGVPGQADHLPTRCDTLEDTPGSVAAPGQASFGACRYSLEPSATDLAVRSVLVCSGAGLPSV
jgi:hypothetical protein